MNKKLFLAITILFCIGCSYLFTFYFYESAMTSIVLMPVLVVWMIKTDSRKLEKRVKVASLATSMPSTDQPEL